MTALILGAAAIGLAIFLVILLLGASSPTAAAPHLSVSRPSMQSRDLVQSGDRSTDLEPLYKRLRSLAGRFTSGGYAASLQRRLDVAGNPGRWTVDFVLTLKGVGLVMGVVLGFLYGLKFGAFGLVAGLLIGFGVGFFLPDVWVRNLGERRQAEIRKGLPDVIDLLTVCVEAGVGFDAALARVAQNIEGPAAQEFARVLQEMQFGKSRAQALRSASERTDVGELRAFVASVVQSNELGISIGDVLRAQSDQMRTKRRQRAEEAAQKLPVKILFPLIVCILPALFVIVIGPAVLNIVHFFAHQ